MFIAACAVVGLLFGSFANVLIARIPTGEQWATGASRCPRCGHDLAWKDNIPLMSWLALHGKCRYCSEPISPQYPLVELAGAVSFAAVAAQFGTSVLTAAVLYLALISIALLVIDLRVFRLPDALVLPSIAVMAVLLAADFLLGGPGSLTRAGIGVAIAGGFYGALWFFYPGGMGFGDVKTAALLGMTLGYLGWASLAVGLILGPIIGGILVVGGLATRKVTRKTRVPYGPALILGAWVGILFGSTVSDWYVGILT